MPTVLRIGAYRFFFYAGDGNEPPHIHVEKEDKVAKYWLDPLRLERSGGFSRAELSRARRIVEEKKHIFMEAWNEYFSC